MPAEPTSTAAFLRRALETLRRRSPGRHADVAAHVERAPVRWSVGGERFTVTARAGRVSVRSGWAAGVAHTVEASAGAPFALFDGTATFEQLLAAEDVVVKVGADALLELAAACAAFAAEAAASPVFARQFEEYRSWAAARR